MARKTSKRNAHTHTVSSSLHRGPLDHKSHHCISGNVSGYFLSGDSELPTEPQIPSARGAVLEVGEGVVEGLAGDEVHPEIHPAPQWLWNCQYSSIPVRTSLQLTL
jgi:hypothetical protein